jgi:hypothetical protein
MRKSVTCKKCGLVSFATTDQCKRCGAKLDPGLTASVGVTGNRQSPSAPRSYTWLNVLGGFAAFVGGFIAFGATANNNTPLALGLFGSVFVGGVVATLGLTHFLKTRGSSPVAQSSSDGKSAKVLVFPLIAFVILLPMVLLRLGLNVEADQLGQAIGRLVANCFMPAIITGIWINRSKQQWSWAGAALRYFVFFIALSVLSFIGSHPGK